jgi:hypothetical protein
MQSDDVGRMAKKADPDDPMKPGFFYSAHG